MLKIKDNVDLKELEKFGFEYSDYFNKYECIKSYNHCKIDIIMRIYCDTRELEIYSCTNWECDDHIINDFMIFFYEVFIKNNFIEIIKEV